MEYKPSKEVVEQIEKVVEFLTNYYGVLALVKFHTSDFHFQRGLVDIHLYKNPDMELDDQEYHSISLVYDKKYVYKELDFTKRLAKEFLQAPNIEGLPESEYKKMTRIRKKEFKIYAKQWKILLSKDVEEMLKRYREGIYLNDFILLKKVQFKNPELTFKRIIYTLNLLKEEGVLDIVMDREEYKLTNPKGWG